MYKTGDKIILKNSGVCEISDIVNEDYGSGKTKYYVIRPVFHNLDNVIRIPVDRSEQVRSLLSKKEINNLINNLKHCENLWISEVKQRKEAFNDILIKGDEKEIASLLYTIYLKKEGLKEKNKQLSMSDRAILDNCERILFEEIATVMNIDYFDVHDLIFKEFEKIEIE